MARDPVDGVSGTTTEANPYHYTNNSPSNLTDPTGNHPGPNIDSDLVPKVSIDFLPRLQQQVALGQASQVDAYDVILDGLEPAFERIALPSVGSPSPREDVRGFVTYVARHIRDPLVTRVPCSRGGIPIRSARGIPVWCVSPVPFMAEHIRGETIGHTIFCNTSEECDSSNEVHRHEMVHVNQYDRYGDNFYTMFQIAATIQRGMGGVDAFDPCNNRYEKQAYDETGSERCTKK